MTIISEKIIKSKPKKTDENLFEDSGSLGLQKSFRGERLFAQAEPGIVRNGVGANGCSPSSKIVLFLELMLCFES